MEQRQADRCAPLPAGTNLHRRYTVREPVLQTEYETVYRGFDYIARQEVSIREFFPCALAMRPEGSGAVSPRFKSLGALFFLASEAYVRQYGTLTQALGNPNLLSVFEAFIENGTAYAVTERLSGSTLTDYLAMEDRLLSPGEAVYLAQGVSDALLVVHSLSILHHDISPDTIFISTDGTVKLTDFGAGKRTVQTRHEVDDTIPNADIRALGLALYGAVTGRVQRNMPAVSADAALPVSLSDMLERMLSPDPAIRFQSVFELRYAAYALDILPKALSITEAQTAAWQQERQKKAAQKYAFTKPQRYMPNVAGENTQKKKRETDPAFKGRMLRAVWLVLAALLFGLAVALWLRFGK